VLVLGHDLNMSVKLSHLIDTHLVVCIESLAKRRPFRSAVSSRLNVDVGQASGSLSEVDCDEDPVRARSSSNGHNTGRHSNEFSHGA
jgi:hypothetical protein